MVPLLDFLCIVFIKICDLMLCSCDTGNIFASQRNQGSTGHQDNSTGCVRNCQILGITHEIAALDDLCFCGIMLIFATSVSSSKKFFLLNDLFQQGLEHAIAGTSLYVVGRDDDLEEIKRLAMEDMESVLSRIDKSGEGVCVQASTLGSLEALLEFLKSPAVQIPVSSISIGPVHKKDVMKASVMLERKKEYATILAFDVKVTPEAREYAEEVGVKIFMADIIYHLFDQFKAYIENIKEEKRREAADEAVFPCVLKIIPNCVFNKKDPIVLGVDVLEGIAKVFFVFSLFVSFRFPPCILIHT